MISLQWVLRKRYDVRDGTMLSRRIQVVNNAMMKSPRFLLDKCYIEHQAPIWRNRSLMEIESHATARLPATHNIDRSIRIVFESHNCIGLDSNQWLFHYFYADIDATLPENIIHNCAGER